MISGSAGGVFITGSISGETDTVQVLKSGPYPNTSFIGVMTQAERLGTKPTIGTMVYQTDGTAGIYIYNGTAWTSAIN